MQKFYKCFSLVSVFASQDATVSAKAQQTPNAYVCKRPHAKPCIVYKAIRLTDSVYHVGTFATPTKQQVYVDATGQHYVAA